jgi:hypothetical protein
MSSASLVARSADGADYSMSLSPPLDRETMSAAAKQIQEILANCGAVALDGSRDNSNSGDTDNKSKSDGNSRNLKITRDSCDTDRLLEELVKWCEEKGERKGTQLTTSESETTTANANASLICASNANADKNINESINSTSSMGSVYQKIDANITTTGPTSELTAASLANSNTHTNTNRFYTVFDLAGFPTRIDSQNPKLIASRKVVKKEGSMLETELAAQIKPKTDAKNKRNRADAAVSESDSPDGSGGESAEEPLTGATEAVDEGDGDGVTVVDKHRKKKKAKGKRAKWDSSLAGINLNA